MSNCIYIIKNFANNKKYIGKCEREGEPQEIAYKRFLEHFNEANNPNSIAYDYCLSRAIRKWGRNNFDYAILAENVPKNDIMIIEAHYIDLYGTTNPDFGYNMSKGHNDNSNFQDYDEIKPESDYSDNSRMNFDDISNEDIEKFLKEF